LSPIQPIAKKIREKKYWGVAFAPISHSSVYAYALEDGITNLMFLVSCISVKFNEVTN
jgi:hypothetical protein